MRPTLNDGCMTKKTASARHGQEPQEPSLQRLELVLLNRGELETSADTFDSLNDRYPKRVALALRGWKSVEASTFC